MKQIITQNEQKLEQIDAVSASLSREDRDPVKIRNYTLPGKKSILGQSTEDREGIFVEGLTKEELHAVIDRAKAEDALMDHADQIRKEADLNARNIELQAEQQAQMMINRRSSRSRRRNGSSVSATLSSKRLGNGHLRSKSSSRS
jgi:ribosomal protein L24